MGEKTKKFILAKISLAIMAGALLLPVFGASAQGTATLFFSPSSGNFSVGQRFSVGVFVQSREQSMNAFETTVRFPTDKLEVTGLSKTGIITSLFVQEPSYSNAAGTVTLVGVVLNPGYTGSSGKLITVNFRAKAVGGAQLTMTGSSVLANDGQGTNILSGVGSANFAITAAPPVKEEPTTPPAAPEAGEVPAAPKVTSTTHPDSSKWYSNNEPVFNWELTKDITGASFLADQKPVSNPGTKSDGLLSSYSAKGFEDGVWYFHLRLKNSAGWGDISHYKFQIDTEKPEKFEIKEITRVDPTEPKAQFTFDAADKTSGIDFFEVQIDDGGVHSFRDDGTHIYSTGILGPGKHRLNAKAIDRAGNGSPLSVEFAVEGLISPKITDWPREIISGAPLEVKGTTYADSVVTLWILREGDAPKSKRGRSNSDGRFVFAFEEKLPVGLYKIWAEVTDSRGARSGPSESVATQVLPTPFQKFLTRLLEVVVPLLNLLLLLLLLLLYLLRKFLQWKKRLRKEIREAGASLHKAFDLLREDLRTQVRLLQKVKSRRELTQEEERILKKLQKDLDAAEAMVKKEIQDVERELK
ncbi:hypothetical protein HYT45_04470 [Candidatus Uhrbacteria bacterium]|nr:hypothetical protein [Candidatus Uhrbacteria bacterium]